MFFASRVFQTSKDTEYPQAYEDAYCVDDERGIAAIADGVSSAIFSGPWARILTRETVLSPPNLNDQNEFRQWLAARRAAWIEQIDVPKLPWNVKAKLQQVNGGYSTLLWLELYECDAEASEAADDTPGRSAPDVYRIRCFSIGDCSLFHVRGGQILRFFPLEKSDDFEQDPISICSVDLKRDHALEFRALDDFCQTNDLIVLCSDPIGKWAFQRMEAGDPPDWESYWTMPDDDWREEVFALRRERQMKFDDTTLVLLRVGAGAEVVEPAADDGSRIDEPFADRADAETDVESSPAGQDVASDDSDAECSAATRPAFDADNAECLEPHRGEQEGHK